MRRKTLSCADGGTRQCYCAHADVQAAVEAGRVPHAAGDMVLLSPGAASFGMFVNEFERGDTFREIVNAL